MKTLRILTAAFALTLLVSSPAAAHTELVSSNPSEGSILATAPAEIVLTFTEPPLLEGSAISVKSDTGASSEAAPVTLVGSELHAAWPASVTSGNITINWRAVADDGHVVTGAITFTIGDTAIASPLAVTTSADDSSTHSKTKTPWVGLGVVLLAGIVLAGVLARKNR